MTSATMLPSAGLTLPVGTATRRTGACGGVRRLHRWWLRVVGGQRQGPAGDCAPMPSGHRPDPAPRSRPTGGELAEQRAAALRRLFPKLSSWQALPSFAAQVQAAYDELSKASDADDLARRVRRIEQVARPGDALRGLATSPA